LGIHGSLDHLKIRMFPLSLSTTAFSWFLALSPNSIRTWSQLEPKFHEHFDNGDNELRLSHLTSIRQKLDEPVAEYIRRFRDTKN
jgi:DNA-binding response OmpR family regulator